MMNSSFLGDYSTEDYEDWDDYCIVPEVSQTTHPIHHETYSSNEALNLMIEWPEVTALRSNQVMFSSEPDDEDEVPNMENEVEESDSKAITTDAPATSNSLTALTVMDWIKTWRRCCLGAPARRTSAAPCSRIGSNSISSRLRTFGSVSTDRLQQRFGRSQAGRPAGRLVKNPNDCT